MVIGEFMYPICAVWTFINNQVDWSGVVYTRSNGKVCKVCILPTSHYPKAAFSRLFCATGICELHAAKQMHRARRSVDSG